MYQTGLYTVVEGSAEILEKNGEEKAQITSEDNQEKENHLLELPNRATNIYGFYSG